MSSSRMGLEYCNTAKLKLPIQYFCTLMDNKVLELLILYNTVMQVEAFKSFRSFKDNNSNMYTS